MNGKKCVAALTACCFLFSFIIAPPLQASLEMKREGGELTRVLNEFTIPSTVGRITKGRYFGSSKVLVNIQDLHCHPEVQKNVCAMLALLDGRCKLEKVYVEGAFGKIDDAWLRDIADKKLRQEMIETLLAQGKLTGSEYYALTRGRSGLLQGMEDEAPYRENIVRLGRIQAKKKYFTLKSARLRQDLDFMEAKYFSGMNKRFNGIVESHRAGKLSTEKYYLLLMKYPDKINENPGRYTKFLTIRKDRYPNIAGYLELAEMGKRLQYERVSPQLQEFVRVLKQKIPFTAYNELVERTDNFSKLDVLYVYLSRISREYGFDPGADYPDLARFFAYIEKSQAVNPLLLVKEERKLVEEIRIGLSGDVAELEVSFLADFFAYFDDYLNNRLSAEDYEYFAKRSVNFKRLWGKYASNDHLAELADDFALLDEYYRVNGERNGYFIRNILGDFRNTAECAEEKGCEQNIARTMAALDAAEEVVVVVTGGFHTEGLEKLLEERRISYLEITPNVTQDAARSGEIYQELTSRYAKVLSSALAPWVLLSMPRGTAEYEAVRAVMLKRIETMRPGDLYDRCRDLEALGAQVTRKENGVAITIDGKTLTLTGRDGKYDVTDERAAPEQGADAGKPAMLAASVQCARDALSRFVSEAGALASLRLPSVTFDAIVAAGILAAENGWATGDGPIYDIDKDKSLREIAGVPRAAVERLVEPLQAALLERREREGSVRRAADESQLLRIVLAVDFVRDFARELAAAPQTVPSAQQAALNAREQEYYSAGEFAGLLDNTDELTFARMRELVEQKAAGLKEKYPGEARNIDDAMRGIVKMMEDPAWRNEGYRLSDKGDVVYAVTMQKLVKAIDFISDTLINAGEKEKARFGGYAHVYLARDGGILRFIRDAIDRQNGVPKDEIVYYLSRVKAGHLYQDVLDLKAEAVSNGQVDYEKFFELFAKKYRDGDDAYRSDVRAIKDELVALGLREQGRIMVVDTGLAGSMPLLIKGVIRLFPDEFSAARDGGDIDFVFLNASRDLGPGRTFAYGTADDKEQAISAVEHGLHHALAYDPARGRLDDASPSDILKAHFERLLMVRSVKERMRGHAAAGAEAEQKAARPAARPGEREAGYYNAREFEKILTDNGELTVEQIRQLLEQQAAVLAAAHPGEKGNIERAMKELRAMMDDPDANVFEYKTPEEGDFGTYIASFRKLSQAIDFLVKTIVNAQEGDRFAGYTKVYLARSGGMLRFIQDAVDRKNGVPGSELTYYLSRVKAGRLYDEVNYMQSRSKAGGVIQREKFFALFSQAYLNGEPAFRDGVLAIKNELLALGLQDKNKILLLDTGYNGSMPMLVQAVIRLFPEEFSANRGGAVEFVTINANPSLGPGKTFAYGTAREKADAWEAVERGLHHGLAYDRATKQLETASPVDVLKAQFERLLAIRSVKNARRPSTAPKAILPGNLAVVNQMANEGASAWRIAVRVSLIEFLPSVLRPFTFIRAHADRRGAAAVVAAGLAAGIGTFVLTGGAFALLPLVFSVAAGAFANVTVHAFIDWHYVGTSGLIEAARDYGTLGPSFLDENGGVHTVVDVAEGDLQDPEQWELRNTGLKADGKTIWATVRAGRVALWADGVPAVEVRKAADRALTGGAEGLKGDPRAIARFRQLMAGLPADARTGNVAARATYSRGIVIDQRVAGNTASYDEDGTMIVGRDMLLNEAGEFERAHAAVKLGELVTIRNAEAYGIMENVFVSLDDVADAAGFLENIELFNQAGNGQIIVRSSVFDGVSERKLREMARLAGRNGVRIFVDVMGDAAKTAAYRNAGFAGYVTGTAGAVRVIDFVGEGAVEANVIQPSAEAPDRTFDSTESLVKAMREAAKPGKIVRIRDLRALAGERSIVDRVAVARVLKLTEILSLYRRDMLTEKYVTDAGRGWDREKLPPLPENTDALVEQLKYGAPEAITDAMGLGGKSHAVKTFLSRIAGEAADGEQAKKLQQAFLRAIAERMLAKAALEKEGKGNGLADPYQERLLGTLLLRQQMIGGQAAAGAETSPDKARRIREIREQLRRERQSGTATAEEFFNDLAAGTAELNAIRQESDRQTELLAIQTLLELLPMSEPRLKTDLRDKHAPAFNLRSAKQIFAAA